MRKKSAEILVSLKNAGNSVFVVEHNRQMISLADHVIEMGEGAGVNGGNIVFQGSLDDLKKTQTKTALTLSEKITVNKNPLNFTEFFELKDLHSHNLKHIDVKNPKAAQSPSRCRHWLHNAQGFHRHAFGRRNPAHKTCERTSQKRRGLYSRRAFHRASQQGCRKTSCLVPKTRRRRKHGHNHRAPPRTHRPSGLHN